MTTHQDTSTERDLVANMRALEADHEPDGWPAVRMSTISHLCDVIERMQAALASRDEAAQQPQDPELLRISFEDRFGALFDTERHADNGEYVEPDTNAAWLVYSAVARQQPQRQAVSDDVICVMVERLLRYSDIRKHDPRESREVLRELLTDKLRAILALRPDQFPDAGKMMQLSDDFATIAGLESAVGHLSTLVDEQRALLVESEDVFGRDGHGGRYEDGECNLIDRIRAHLEMTAPPPNGTTAKEQGNG